MGWRKAALLSSLLFSLSHLTPTAILPIFAIGWLFSFLYERSRSIWPCTLLHALINLIGLGAAYLLTQLGGAAIPP
jgi:membrane protease YdiL (CAAX protease family)